MLEGRVSLAFPARAERVLEPGGFAYCPPGAAAPFNALAPSRLNIFEKRYVPRPYGASSRADRRQRERGRRARRFWVIPMRCSRCLLPADSRFDLAVNVFTFQPGAALPLVEMHVMEQGLLMLEGQGVYRLDEEWYPVRAGRRHLDGPILPAVVRRDGQDPARYLYYKDVNRDPMEELE